MTVTSIYPLNKPLCWKLGQIQSLNCTKLYILEKKSLNCILFVHFRKRLFVLQNTCTISLSTKRILNLNFVTSSV